jgi:hypothetical protein
MIQPRRLGGAEMTLANHLERRCAGQWLLKQMACGPETAFEQREILR